MLPRDNGLPSNEWLCTKWTRKLLGAKHIERVALESVLPPLVPAATGGGVLFDFVLRGQTLVARLDYSNLTRTAYFDSAGKPLLNPQQRETTPVPCRGCPEQEYCRSVEIIPSPAHAWRRIGLVEPDGKPARRGIIFGFFNHGEGLAVAAALEDTNYEIESLVFDLANLRAGHRFSEQDSPYGGRLGALCQRVYERADYPGYLDMGVPVDYGAGASEVVREIIKNRAPKQKMVTESLRPGDIERAILEWRSLLRHILWAPGYDWTRWNELKAAAGVYVDAKSALPELPPLLPSQRLRREVGGEWRAVRQKM